MSLRSAIGRALATRFPQEAAGRRARDEAEVERRAFEVERRAFEVARRWQERHDAGAECLADRIDAGEPSLDVTDVEGLRRFVSERRADRVANAWATSRGVELAPIVTAARPRTPRPAPVRQRGSRRRAASSSSSRSGGDPPGEPSPEPDLTEPAAAGSASSRLGGR